MTNYISANRNQRGLIFASVVGTCSLQSPGVTLADLRQPVELRLAADSIAAVNGQEYFGVWEVCVSNLTQRGARGENKRRRKTRT